MRLEVFPKFSLNIELVEFNSIDLVHGFYQIRFRFKQSFPFTYDLKCDQKPGTSKNLPQVHYQTAVSRPIKIAFNEQAVELNDVFQVSVNLHKRYDKIDPCNLEIQVELWYLDPETKPLLENYTFVSKRLVNVLLRPDRSQHNHRHIFFEYFSFSAVSLTIHSCVTDMIFNPTKSLESPLNEKLKNYHRKIVTRMLGSYLSMQNFIKNYAHILTSPLKIVCLDIDREICELQETLANSDKPWQTFQDDVKRISGQLKQLFTQLVQLFNCSRPLSLALLEEFDQKRIKRCAEGFLFVEDSVQSLLDPKVNHCGRIFEAIKKSSYLNKLPKTPLRVEGTDIEPSNITLILEHRYLPAGATFSSNGDLVENEVLLNKIPQINTDSLSTADTISRELTNSSSRRSSSRPSSRRSSSEKFQFVASMCFPINRSSNLPDDSYGFSKSNHLSPNANDRWSNRRMTDPCASGIHVNESDSTCLNPIQVNNSSPNGTLKSKSIANIIAKNENQESSIPCTSRSSSSDSLIKPSVSTSPKNTEINTTSPTNEKVLLKLLDQDLVIFAEEKEALKQRLRTLGYKGLFYSDSKFFNWRPYFSTVFSEAIEKRNIEFTHLVVFVHGLEGTSEDLSAYKNYLRIALPNENFVFLLSEANQTETWNDFNSMAENLLKELLRFVERLPRLPDRISIVAHSLGGLIIRTMIGLEKVKSLLPRFYTLITLNSPHLGLLYNQRTANWGISILQFWKNSKSLEQLTMRDATCFQDTFLYKLSRNNAFSYFKTVLLVGSYLDLYVPLHSALIEPCKPSVNDPSAQGSAYNEMLTAINDDIVSSSRHTTLVKYSVAHSLTNVSKAQQVTGRANHISCVDDDTFIERMLLISAAKYFQ